MAAKRRTKKDLERAEKHRLKKVKQKISAGVNHKTSNKFLNSTQPLLKQTLISNDESRTPDLYARVFGYSFDLIKQDLFKTILSTLFVSTLLLLIYLFNLGLL
jgi:hypothetical protein